MKTLNGLPVFKMTIDENDNFTGVEFISLVDQPAIEVNWVAFSNDKKPMKMAFDADKQLLTGPAMIPDLPIYRYSEDMGEYYVTFSVDEIQKIARKFAKEQRTLGINYMHQNNSQVASAVITEFWFISDKENDKSNSFGYDLPIGTWMVTTYIADKEFWNKEIKSGNVRGYSIEGYLNLEMNKINKNNKYAKMTKIKFEAEIKTADGVVLYTPQDSFVEGSEVFTVDADGNQAPAADGDYVLENGATISVKDGKITAVVEPQAQSTESTEETFALSDADIKTIMDALAPSLQEWADKIAALEAKVAELESANTQMKETMSKLPGAPAKSTKTDGPDNSPKKKMDLFDKVQALKDLKSKK